MLHLVLIYYNASLTSVELKYTSIKEIGAYITLCLGLKQ